MLLRLKTSVVLLSLLSLHPLFSQIRVNRAWEINPLEIPSDKKRQFLGNILFSAEAGHGWFSSREALTWTIRYQGFVEFIRWDSTRSLGLYLGHELQANPFNDIYFNPRGSYWNESLIYSHKIKSTVWQAGVNHRCRHNIDNADPPSPGRARGYQGEGRVIVLTAVTLGAVKDPIQLSPKSSLQVFGRGYYYLYTEDSRRPIVQEIRSWEDLRASFHPGYYFRFKMKDHLHLYQRSILEYMIRERYANGVNYRIEGGVDVQGAKAKLQVFTAWEHLFDDATEIIPQSSGFLQLGLRVSTAGFY